MATFSSKGLQNDNVRVTKSEVRFGPLRMQRVSAIPSSDEGRIGDIVIVDDSKGNDISLPIDRVPTFVGIFQKAIGGGVSAVNAGGNQVQVLIPGITYRDENVAIAGAPHSIVNYTGGGVTAIDSGSGVVSVGVPGITFREEGVNLAGSPHTVLNFVGSTVTASNTGGGVANVTVLTPRVSTAIIGATTDTTQIAFDNSVPLITEGTQIATAAIAPQSTSNRVEISLSFSWEHDALDRGIAVAVFRGNTLVGLTADMYAGGGTVVSNSLLRNVSYSFVDSPGTTSNTTYSVRVGANDIGTWRVNTRANGNNFGGAMINSNTFVLKEILV